VLTQRLAAASDERDALRAKFESGVYNVVQRSGEDWGFGVGRGRVLA
jgi:hypothetical protein